MHFAPSRKPDDGHDKKDRRWPAARWLGRALVGCCAAAAASAAFPWTQVHMESLWGEFFGPIAARTDAGFTCLMTSLLTALLVLSEGRSAQAREAVRTACLLLTGIALLALLARMWNGPGMLRGVTAAHSAWFFTAIAAVGSAVVASRMRLPTRRKEDASHA